MDDLKTQVEALAPEQWGEFLGWVVNTERARRDALPAVEEAQAKLVEELWEARPDLKPAAGTTEITPAETAEALVAQVKQWQQPATPLDGYPRSELAALGGRVWRNRRPGNVKKPGTPFSGWEDVTDDYLKLADAQDGNAPDAATTDAPGLITEPEKPAPEPEPEVTPADTVPPYRDGEKLAKGETRRYTDGKVYVWQKNKLEATKPETAPDKNTGHWLHLG